MVCADFKRRMDVRPCRRRRHMAIFVMLLHNKKALDAFASRTNIMPVVPPCFTDPSRNRPLRVPTHSCAMTGAPVAAYAVNRSRCATPRPCSARPSVPVFTGPGSLCRISALTLLFIVFAVFSCWVTVYPQSPRLSRKKFMIQQEKSKADLCGFHKNPGLRRRKRGNLPGAD